MAAQPDKRFLRPTHPDALCIGCGAPINPKDPDGILRRTRGVCKRCRCDEPPCENDISPCRCHFCASCNLNNPAPAIIGTSPGPRYRNY